ncbi:retropepsin-like domain-containing protein [bacterium]|nr:hypothetical protein [Candidatus Omnitrophota bacterium]MBU2528403.1 retropepsin-like domain-containing protein [bacterium]MBU3930661.1 retropepsin-like domain-containing protein [bacterium]MBU4123431.1 retropepsin-like domain-containing protein [bacterium]
MNNGRKFHHAFKIQYPGITRVLVTDCKIAIPLAIDSSKQKHFFSFKAIWDTGATNTVITDKVAKEVSLSPTGMAETHGVHGKSQVNTFIVDILLPNRVCIPNIRVSEGKLLDEIDVLIGMDIIQVGDFAISNANGKTLFSYCLPPHKNPVDLLEKSECINARYKR